MSSTFVILAIWGSMVIAQSVGYQLSLFSFSSSGRVISENGRYSVNHSIGVPVAGTSSNGRFELSNGLFGTDRVTERGERRKLYLPAAIRQATPTPTPVPAAVTEPAILLADTYIASGKPTQRKSENRAIWVGYNQSDGLNEMQALVKFDLTMIPTDSTIVSAIFRVQVGGADGDAQMDISVSELTGEWEEEINWSEHQNSLNSGRLTEDSAHSVTQKVNKEEGATHSWDIQNLVQSWVNQNDTENELGLILKGNKTSGTHERAFSASECNDSECDAPPQLTVTYRP